MLRRVCWISGCVFLAGSAPAFAGEVWLCSVLDSQPSPGAIVGGPGHIRIELNGDDMSWQVVNWVDPAQHRHLLVNNEIGAVAVFVQATDKPADVKVTGLSARGNAAMQKMLTAGLPDHRVNSYTTALDKRTGKLRTGSVGTTGV